MTTDDPNIDSTKPSINTIAWRTLPKKLDKTSDRSSLQQTLLSSPPSMGKMYLRALKRRSGLARGDSIPALQVESPFKISSSWLESYLNICGWHRESSSGYVPLTAPQAFSAPLHMYLLTHSAFPAPTLGVVHAANQMIAYRPLSTSDELTIRSWTGETRWKSRGFEVDLHTAITAHGEESPSWLGRTTVYRSVRVTEEDSREERPAEVIIDGDRSPLNLSADLGRRYAPVAGDYNPIHLYPITAKIFGFKRPIIHGMWTVAHLSNLGPFSLEELQVGRMSVLFKRPLSLPLASESMISSFEGGTAMQALDHRGKLSVDVAFSPHFDPQHDGD